MDEPAKQPKDTDIEGNYIDIYLFSNGQQQTPPRKYHLLISDLNNWQETLKRLAHFQYGIIFSSIDLYTVAGNKVLTPMQLSDGMAYVAVPPQDTFIFAGYNDYLMKASRLREKRKLASTTQESQNKIVEKNYEKNINDRNEKDISQSTAKSNTSTNNLTTKAIATRKSLHTSSLILPQATARKTSMKSKDSNMKKNLKVNTNNIMTTTSQDIAKVNSNNAPCTKIITKVKQNSTPDIPINISTVEESVHKYTSHEKYITTVNSAIENVLDDHELIVVKNPDSEAMCLEIDKSPAMSTRQPTLTHEYPILTPIHEGRKLELSKKDDVPCTIINNVVENVYKPEVIKADDNISKHNSNLHIAKVHNTGNNSKTIVNNKPDTDKFIAVVNRMDGVNLNIKIEFRNGAGAISDRCDTCPKKIHNITEKSLQVNIDQVFSGCKTKHSQLSNNPASDEMTPKVVIVHCECCNHHKSDEVMYKIDTVKLDDTNYIILLPTSENIERCNKDRPANKTLSHLSLSRQSTENPVKKVFGSTWVHEILRNVEQSEHLFIKEDGENVVQKVKSIHNVSATKQDVAVVSSKPEITVVHSKDNVIYRDEGTASVSKINIVQLKAENNTQTDWCSMLLEARLHEDGRYTFHLPPLHVLKYYGF